MSRDAIFASMTALRIETWTHLAAQGPALGRMLRGERAIDLLIWAEASTSSRSSRSASLCSPRLTSVDKLLTFLVIKSVN